MSRALSLAARGLGKVSPNPMVGCVIVSGDSIIAEGWHQHYGGPHAEVEALSQMTSSQDLSECTAYVNLEPCSHFGKTPPCADLLISRGIGRVVVGCSDPNPVAGGGNGKLQKAGIKVNVGILKEESRYLNRRFFCRHEKSRPYIILKWAQTPDGFIARPDYQSKWISGPESRKLVHKWRSEEDTVMVGANTVYHDNPSLNVRDWQGPNPTRILVDRNLRLEPTLKIFDQSQPTICYNTRRDHQIENLIWVRLKETNFLDQLFADLASRNVLSVMVEGGAILLQELITLGLWDEIRLFQGSEIFREGIQAPKFSGKLAEEMVVKEDLLKLYTNA